jgi:hypothetical protein
MEFIPQKHIAKQGLTPFPQLNKYNTLESGTVVSVNEQSGTVDVELDIGRMLEVVPVLCRKMFFQDLANGVKDSLKTMDMDLPVLGSRVVVGYLNGMAMHPFVMGCIPQSGIEKVIPKNKKTKDIDGNKQYYLHQSRYWEKVDAKGNFEQYFPDGTQISVSNDVVTKEDKLSYQEQNTPKTLQKAKVFRIKHTTGAIIMVDAEGNIEVSPAKDQTITFNVGSNDDKGVLTEQVPLGKLLVETINGFIKHYLHHYHTTIGLITGCTSPLIDPIVSIPPIPILTEISEKDVLSSKLKIN